MNPKLRILLALAATIFAPAASAQRLGSIYDAGGGPIRAAANKTAARVGDLVTVVISENQDVRNEEKTDLQKSSDLRYRLLNFDIDPETFNTLPQIAADREDNFLGNARYEKKGKFNARLTAIVMDTLPNGNLVLQGRRELRLDGEVKVIEFSGIVRRYDISAANTVESELVADANIKYSGRGPLTQTTSRWGLGSWVHAFLDWLWPF